MDIQQSKLREIRAMGHEIIYERYQEIILKIKYAEQELHKSTNGLIHKKLELDIYNLTILKLLAGNILGINEDTTKELQ